jgi:hypothetical protein
MNDKLEQLNHQSDSLNDKNNSIKPLSFGKLIKVILFFLVFSLIIFFAFKLWNNIFISKRNSNTQQNQNFNYQAPYWYLKQKTMFSLPETISTTESSLNEIPSEIQKLILTDAQNIKIYKLFFTDNKSGFRITYEINSDFHILRKKFQDLLGPWIKRVLTTDYDAILEADSENYHIQITQRLKNNENNIIVIIEYF